MGACYSGQASKSCPTDTQTPIDPKTRPIECHNSAEDIDNIVDHCRQLTITAGNLAFAQHIDHRKGDRLSSMSSSQPNRNQKIPIASSKLVANHRVVPKPADDYAFNKYKTRRYDGSATGDNKVMIFDNSSTTSISSDCSVNLSKSSKSTSSSASNVARLQTSIPRPANSRTPTPPIPAKYTTNQRKAIQTQPKYSERNVKSGQNQNNTINDRLNGNEVVRSDIKVMKTKSTASSDLNATKTHNNNNGVIAGGPTGGQSYGTSIRYTTQVSGLPRPQTAHIVSTSSQSADNHKIKTVNYMENRLKHGSDSKTSNARCDPSLRQVKPYFYGMNNNNKPYERPNAAPNSGNNFNYNRLQYSSQPPNQCKPVFTPNNSYTTPNSQHINQKPKPIASNGSLKSKLDFGTPLMPKANRDDSSAKEIRNASLENKNQNYIKNSVTSETNDGLDCNSNDNSFLPKSIQRMRELTPHFVRKDPKTSSNKDVRSEPKSEEPTPEPRVKRDSISGGVGANSEVDNRDFLIDDEISDQPELTLGCNIDKKDLMKTLNSELEGLILKQESPSGPSSPSVSLSSSASTVIPSSTTFRNRKPRPLSLVEMADGSVGLDSPSFRAASQDLIGIKTLLFRLHGLLQNAETLNPFEHNYTQNKFYNQLTIAEDDNLKSIDSDDLSKENFDLKRQIVLQQQIIEDKDRTIRLLQQQMAKYSNINSAYIPQNVSVEKVNASCQTDRCANASNINPRAVSDGSNGMLVSFWISKVPAFA